MFVFLTALTVSFALGVVMHTISRGLFHKQKGRWTLEILGSRAVRNRLAALGRVHPLRGGPTYADLWEEEDPDDRAVIWPLRSCTVSSTSSWSVHRTFSR